jgi:hypothetical protein
MGDQTDQKANDDQKNVDGNQTDNTNVDNGQQKVNTNDDQQAKNTHTITVNGQKREVTLEEALKLAEKSAGADEKFRAAAEKEKAGEEGLRFKALMTKIQDEDYKPSKAEAAELGSYIGIDPEAFMAYLEEGSGTNPAEGTQDVSKEFAETFKAQFGMGVEDAKDILSLAHQTHVNNAREQIRGEADKAVDTDEFFGKLKVGKDGTERMEAIKEMVAEDVFGRIINGDKYGPDLVAASIQKVRSLLKRYGMPASPTEQFLNMGPGPSGGFPAEVQSETPIKRVSAAEDTDGSNFIKRWQQKMLMKMRSAGNR